MARLSFQQLHALYKKEKSFSDDVIRALGEKQAEAWKKFCPPKRSQPSESGVRSQLLGMGLQPTDESGKIRCQVGDLGVFYFSPDTETGVVRLLTEDQKEIGQLLPIQMKYKDLLVNEVRFRYTQHHVAKGGESFQLLNFVQNLILVDMKKKFQYLYEEGKLKNIGSIRIQTDELTDHKKLREKLTRELTDRTSMAQFVGDLVDSGPVGNGEQNRPLPCLFLSDILSTYQGDEKVIIPLREAQKRGINWAQYLSLLTTLQHAKLDVDSSIEVFTSPSGRRPLSLGRG